LTEVTTRNTAAYEYLLAHFVFILELSFHPRCEFCLLMMMMMCNDLVCT